MTTVQMHRQMTNVDRSVPRIQTPTRVEGGMGTTDRVDFHHKEKNISAGRSLPRIKFTTLGEAEEGPDPTCLV